MAASKRNQIIRNRQAALMNDSVQDISMAIALLLSCGALLMLAASKHPKNDTISPAAKQEAINEAGGQQRCMLADLGTEICSPPKPKI